jgi:hypothetical protein
MMYFFLSALIVLVVRDLDLEAGRSSQVPHDVVSQAGLNTLVRAVNLGPDLLEDQHPQLVALRLREAAVAVFVAGEELINNDLLGDTVLLDADGEDTELVHTISDEQPLDAVRDLSDD